MAKKRRLGWQELYGANGSERIRYLTKTIFALLEEKQMMSQTDFEGYCNQPSNKRIDSGDD